MNKNKKIKIIWQKQKNRDRSNKSLMKMIKKIKS